MIRCSPSPESGTDGSRVQVHSWNRAIVTTAPNELLRDAHDRMPVIPRPEHYSMWLNAPISASGRLADTLLPYDAGAMRRFPVSDCVNVPANENPDCLIETAELIPAQHTLFH